ncbi:hypothetical protein YQE_08004, partial [Dendroctonus ponderosae]
MKAPIKMYHLKPVVVHDFAVEVPKCMYRLESIHKLKKVDDPKLSVSSPEKKLDIFDQNCQDVPGMAELEAKQCEILEQLAALKQQISTLKKDLLIQNEPASKRTPTVAVCPRVVPNIKALPESLVITANPSSPPYALQLVQRLLQNEIGLVIVSYVHSSVVSLSDAVKSLKESLSSFQPPSGVPVVNVKLIWKNSEQIIGSNSEFLLSQTVVSGEVNFLRFLSRLTKTTLTYENDSNALEVDSLLDQCYLLVRTKTKVERSGIIQSLSKALAKASWIAGSNQAGIVDVAAFSAIRQCGISNELNPNLTKWYQKCASLIAS